MVPTAENFDLVIIGGGPAGYAAALYGASAGLHIALIERAKLGGTCLHVGCIPAKELLETAAVYRTVSRAGEFGINAGSPSVDFGVTQARKQQIVDQLTTGLTGLLKRRTVTLFDGTGTLHPGRVVRVSGGASGEVELTGDHVLLASGSVPRTIPGFEVDGRFVVTSDELLSLQTLPATAVVIGGGAIGCEFASMMADLGTEVTVLEALPKILPGCDDDITKLVTRAFSKRGIEVRTGVTVTGHTPGEKTTVVALGDGQSIETELVVVSVGRRPLSETLGLEGTAVEVTERGHVVVDERCRTAEPGVYAAGDLIATPALAHVGFAEGMLVVKDVLGEDPLPIAYDRVPWCIYCHPEVAFAGLSEEAAKEAGYDVVTAKQRYGGNGRAMIVGDNEGMVKIIAERNADGGAGQILGVHMVGPWVTEQLGQAYLAVNWEATAAEVAQFIQPHPTMSEVFGEAAMALTGRSLH
ncbi:dihydrolipoyl dehydrogenase [Rhabdothermincola sediminis]|uniref:dihydrolipoyl dehydrogenase n=1 Tax=Rhabdothermincola sediminis TaxID=2751370 RepID=UPI001AA04316|nr:dihydrolipoyl dehydrogenase [Rhabdothermincola sediminis]